MDSYLLCKWNPWVWLSPATTITMSWCTVHSVSFSLCSQFTFHLWLVLIRWPFMSVCNHFVWQAAGYHEHTLPCPTALISLSHLPNKLLTVHWISKTIYCMQAWLRGKPHSVNSILVCLLKSWNFIIRKKVKDVCFIIRKKQVILVCELAQK